MAAFALMRRDVAAPLIQDLHSPGLNHFLYNMTGYGYVFAWGVSFYPQLILNWRRKSTAGMSIGFLWYNLLGFTLYLVYTCFSPHAALQDQIFAGHALFLTALTMLQVPYYGTNKLGEFPQLHGKIAAVLLMALDICLVLNVVQWMSLMNLIYACGYLKTAISLIKYTPQFYLNYQRKSTAGFAIGMVLFDLMGGTLSIFQQFVSCGYNFTTGAMRPAWTWEPFSGNKPKLFLGMISIVYDLAFLYQHFVLYRAAKSENASLPPAEISSRAQQLLDDAARCTKAQQLLDDAERCTKPKKTEDSMPGRGVSFGERLLDDETRPSPANRTPFTEASEASDDNDNQSEGASEDHCPDCGTEYAPMAATCRRCTEPRTPKAGASASSTEIQA